MYAIDDPFDPRKTVSDYLDEFFSDSRDQMTTELLAMEIDSDMTMREFWNLHAYWSYEILFQSNVPDEVAATAALHHLLEGVLPADVDTEGMVHLPEGERPFGRQEIFVILLDKYDARRRRGNVGHLDAIAYLYERVSHNKILDNMPESIREMFLSCIDDLAEAKLSDADLEGVMA